MDLLNEHQREYFADGKIEPEYREEVNDITQSLNGLNWNLLAASKTSKINPFDDDEPTDSRDLLGADTSSFLIDNTHFVKQGNVNDLSSFPNDISQVHTPTSPKDRIGPKRPMNHMDQYGSLLEMSGADFNTKNVNIFDSNFVLVDNMYDMNLSKATSTPGKNTRRLLSETSKYYDKSLSDIQKTSIRKNSRNLVASLPAKKSNRGLLCFLHELERNSEDLPLNAMTVNLRSYSVEQDDLLDIEETPNFRDNIYYEALCRVMASQNEDQKIVNCDFMITLIKISTSQKALKESLLYVPVRRIEGGRGVVYSSMVDFMLIDTIKVCLSDDSFSIHARPVVLPRNTIFSTPSTR